MQFHILYFTNFKELIFTSQRWVLYEDFFLDVVKQRHHVYLVYNYVISHERAPHSACAQTLLNPSWVSVRCKCFFTVIINLSHFIWLTQSLLLIFALSVVKGALIQSNILCHSYLSRLYFIGKIIKTQT